MGREHDLTALVAVELMDQEARPLYRLGEREAYSVSPAGDGNAYVRLVRTMARTPFPRQMDAIGALIESRRPHVVAVDATPMGMHMYDILAQRWGGSVLACKFTEAEKSDMIGAGYDFYTGGRLKVPDKYRVVLEEIAAIRKEVTEAGRTVYRDDPHGDIAWACLLALWALAKRFPLGAVHPSSLGRLVDALTSVTPEEHHSSLWCSRCGEWTDPAGHQHRDNAKGEAR